MKLNTEQEIAVSHKDGPCLVTACPGSGKTRVLVERTAKLIETGVLPYQILCITFTNKAAKEMRERIEKRIGASAKSMYVVTFHRLCSTILRHYGKPLGYTPFMTILDEDGQVDLMSQIARQKELDLPKPTIKTIVWNCNDSRENLEDDNDLFDRFKKLDENWYPVAVDYIAKLRTSNMIDFSGMLSETFRLFSEHSNILELAQKKWKYFQIDETQDTNLVQFKIIDLLSKHTKNVFIVGDLDQSIYAFRGARTENILDFQKTYPGTKLISLGKNYRSTPEILAVAEKLIGHNTNRIAAPLTTDNPSGSPVACRSFTNDKEEAQFVAKTIKASVESGKIRYKDVAVFYRINSMSRAIEQAFIQHSIPHVLIGGFSFFDRKVVKDCLAMLKFLINPLDSVSFHRFCNKPKRALGDVTVGKIEIFAEREQINILEACKKMDFKAESVREGLNTLVKAVDFDWKSKTIGESLTHVLDALKYREYLESDPETAPEQLQNLEQMLVDVAEYGTEHSQSIANYLEHVALMSNHDKSADGDTVSLQTIHSAKGLEYPVVFILGVEHDLLPHKMALQDRADGLEEERRLFYVGVTRAQQVLTVSHCMRRQESAYASRGQIKYKTSRPSQFLVEAGLIEARKAGLTQFCRGR